MTKKTFFIVASIIIVISVLALTFFLWRQAPQASPEGKKFELLSVDPPFGPDYLYGQSLQVTFTFNQPVNLETFSYSLSPEVEILLRATAGGKQIILSPDGPWPEGNFMLTLSQKTKSLTGEKLGQNYSYRFSVGRDTHGAD